MIYKNAKALGVSLLFLLGLLPLAAQPVLICPPSLTVNIQPGLDSTTLDYVLPTVPTLCPGGQATLTVVVGPPPGGTFNLGANLICLAATDTCGGASSCCFTVTVNATANPSIICPANLTVNASAGATTAIVNYDAPDADSSCASGVLVSLITGPASGDTFPTGSTQVCYAAADSCTGINVCCFTVTVNAGATGVPTITCPANLLVNPAPGGTTAVVNYNLPTASSTCPGTVNVALVSGPAIGGTFQAGPTQVCYMATDACGTTATCCFTVTVQAASQPPTLTCPANVTVDPMPAMNTATVNFNLPTVTTTCPGGANTPTLLSGLGSGSMFPVGNNQVCYQVTDNCGGSATCCFNVTVNAEQACDTKTVGCIKFEILSVAKNHDGDRVYRIRFTNMCSGRTLNFVSLQLPDGTVGPAPASGSIYTAPSGRKYVVRNPNHNPFYSVRFKAVNPAGLAQGQSEIFQYTVIQQAQMTFIHAFARMSSGPNYEVHLNTYDCMLVNQDLTAPGGPSEAISAEPIAIDNGEEAPPTELRRPQAVQVAAYPNPTDGLLYVDLSSLEGQEIRVSVLNARGQQVQTETVTAGNQPHAMRVTSGLSNGLYYLEIEGSNKTKQVQRFVLQR